MDPAAPRAEPGQPDLLRLATAGSVDDGKSTLIGRLLRDCDAVCADHWTAVESASRRLNREVTDLAFLTDGLKAEREQGITIDVAYRSFSTPQRRFILADTPGHEQYTRNMATGASTADLAVLLVDAQRGVGTQSKRHGFIASLLGVPHLVLAVNKMDLVGYAEEVFLRISAEYKAFAARLRIASLVCIPVSALHGDNVARRSARMPWHTGPTLLEYMESLYIGSGRNLVDLRFPIQLVLRPGAHFRGYAGTVLSGVIRAGDEVLGLPSGVSARVQSILGPGGPQPYAFPPQAVTLVLDRELDLARGDMLVHPGNRPHAAHDWEAMLIWMHEQPCRPGQPYLIKHATQWLQGAFTRLHYRVDPNTLHREPAPALGLNEIGRADLRLRRRLCADDYQRNRATGGFIVVDPLTHDTVGVGLVMERGQAQPGAPELTTDAAPEVKTPATAADQPVTPPRQKPCTVWLTGLSGAGKTTVATEVVRQLSALGYAATVLDGDALRSGLNRDLGFAAADRTENVRRAAEVARLMNDAGLTVLVALISPYRADRAAARAIIGPERFREVFVDAPLAVCEARDVKGLYGQARRGARPDFTGVSAPYEPPDRPDLHLPAGTITPAACAQRILDLLRQDGFLAPP